MVETERADWGSAEPGWLGRASGTGSREGSRLVLGDAKSRRVARTISQSTQRTKKRLSSVAGRLSNMAVAVPKQTIRA
jgi:hypothetical protein